MRLKSAFIAIILYSGLSAQTSLSSDTMYNRCIATLDFAFGQANRMMTNCTSNTLPHSLTATGSLYMAGASDWTSGFFPGQLWYLANYKNDIAMKNNAAKFTALLFDQQFVSSHHDLGFMMYCSYGNGLKYFNITDYKSVLIQSAKSLQTRFNANVGCMRSWSWGSWSFPVIIDNMMNLELMCWATKATDDNTYLNGAVSHALKTMTDHYRPNFSSFHLVDYNPTTGSTVGKQTVQGYSNSSSWARGQAWGLYGFTMMYAETGRSEFLDHAKNIAGYILSNLPADCVPFWDYNDPAIPNAPRDASAAAITASALIELYRITTNELYLYKVEKMLWYLSSPTYMNAANEGYNFLLKHSTGNKPRNAQVDVPIIFADYYFVEALCRYVALKRSPAAVSTVQSEASLLASVYGKQLIVNCKNTVIQSISIVNLAGCIIKKKVINTSKVTMDISDLPKGIYVVKATANQSVKSIRTKFAVY